MLHRNILLSLILVSSFFNFILISKGGPEGHVEGSPGVTQAPDTVGGQSSGSALLDALGSGHFDGPPKTYTVPELGGPDVEPTGGPHVEGPGNHDGGDELPPGNPGDVPDPTAGQPVDQPTLPGVDPTGETPGRTPVGPDTGPVMGPTGDPTIGSGPMGDLSQSSPYGLVRQADAILAAKGSRYDASVLFKQAADGYMAEYKKNPTSENFKSAVDAIYEATGSFQKVYDDSGWFSKKLPWGKAKKASEAQVDLTKMLEDINSFNEGQSDSFLKEYSTDTPVEKKKLEEAVQKIKDISEISFDILNRMDRVSPEFSKQLRALNEFLARPEVTKILDAHLEASRPTVDETPITGPGEHGGESGDEPGEKGPEGEEFLEDEEAEEAFFDAEDGSPEEKKIAEAEEKAAAIMVEATVGASATMETVRTPEELQEEALDDQIGFGADFFEIGVGEGILETVGGVVVSAADYARTAWNFVSPGVAKAVEVGSSIIRSTSGFVGRKLDDIGQILEPLGDLGRYGV
ncbi:hypothetical protein HN446_03710, partial [bacterium]|nr:hypothetical protein [bacterium]